MKTAARGRPMEWRSPLFSGPQILVCCISALLYAKCGSYPFVNLDDLVYVVANRHVRRGLTLDGLRWAFTTFDVYWHPLAWVSHMVDVELFGLNPGAHHWVSVAIQATVAALLFIWLFRLTGHAYRSLAVTAFWAMHPLRVESVAWIAERKDVLSGLFGVVTLLTWQRYVKAPSRMRYILALLTFTLALMSKPSLVVLPLLLLVLDYWPLERGRPWRALVLEKAPMLAMSAVVGAITIIAQGNAGALGLVSVPLRFRVEDAAVAAAAYLGKMLWPTNLAVFYPYPKELPLKVITLSAVVLGSVTGFAVWQRRRRPYLVVGWLWYVVSLLPALGLIQAGRQSMGDRFTYWPMIGICIAVVWSVADWAARGPTQQKATRWAAGAGLAVLAFLTVHQTSYWRDSEALFRHAIAVQDSDYMRGSLSEMLTQNRQYGEAESHLRMAIYLAPERFEHHNNLANLFLKAGRLDEAAREAAVALQLNPNHLAVVQTAALVFLRKEDYAAALAQFARAIPLGGDPVAIAAKLSDAGASLASRGRPREAEPLIRRALELNPRLVQARRNLVLVLVDQGRAAEAGAALDDALSATGPQAAYRDLERELEGDPGGARRARTR